MKIKLPKIYPITNTHLSSISHTEQVKRLIAAGAKLIQLREKLAAPSDWFDDALSARELCRENGVTLIINDRVDIALAIRSDGVHLGQTDLPPDAARKLLGDDAIIGFSTHDLEQVREAVSLPIDYIAFGPIFPTTTKLDPDAVVGLEMLEKIRQIATDIPIVAIGGISLNNVVSVIESGADSAAIIGALVTDPSKITDRFYELNSLFDK